jgi:hypothetical protein
MALNPREAGMLDTFSRVLLATEGTEFDVGAERLAIELAGKCGVPLLAVIPLISNPEAEAVGAAVQIRAEAEVAAALDRLRRQAESLGVELRGTVRRGEEPFREIVDEAREQRADLLVLRRRGRRSYLANLLLGEMVHTVIGHSPCDVLIAPRAARMWSKHVVLATDGSAHSERAARVAAMIAMRCAIPVTVVSAADRHDTEAAAAQRRVDRALAVVQAAGAKGTGRAAGGRPHDAIVGVARETGADVIVIGRRGLNPVERLLLGSTSERVAESADCPVLIVRAG